MGVCLNHGRPREVVIDPVELFELPEYSCSIPTGVTPGKRWRKDVHEPERFATGRGVHQAGASWDDVSPEVKAKLAPEWQICEYVVCSCCDDDQIGIAYTWAVGADGSTIRGEKPR